MRPSGYSWTRDLTWESFKPTGGPTWQKSAFLPEHPDNRRISAHIGLGRRRIASGAKPLAMRDSSGGRVTSRVNRTQEVGGSNPPSSIGGSPCTWERVTGHITINRPRFLAQTQALVPEFRGLPPIYADYGSIPTPFRRNAGTAFRLIDLRLLRRPSMLLRCRPEGGRERSRRLIGGQASVERNQVRHPWRR